MHICACGFFDNFLSEPKILVLKGPIAGLEHISAERERGQHQKSHGTQVVDKLLSNVRFRRKFLDQIIHMHVCRHTWLIPFHRRMQMLSAPGSLGVKSELTKHVLCRTLVLHKRELLGSIDLRGWLQNIL